MTKISLMLFFLMTVFNSQIQAKEISLIVRTQDVLDLATYHENPHLKISFNSQIKEKISFDFTLDDWAMKVEGYQINLTGFIQKIDADYYYFNIRKSLLKNQKIVKILTAKKWSMAIGDKHDFEDLYWGNEGLIVRQITTFNISDNN